MARLIITGANGHLGRRLIEALSMQGHELCALVRSTSAAEAIHRQHPALASLNVGVVDYRDATAIAGWLEGTSAVVHLVGIIRETPGNRYRDAHEATCTALVEAARMANVSPHVIYLSILGSNSSSLNACLHSKGAAEEILLASGLPVTVLQVPMVLGEDDFATAALRHKAMSAVSFGFRLGSLEQPVYAGDVVAAIQGALSAPPGGRLLLAGPESLTRLELVRRAGAVLGNQPKQISLPIALGRFIVSTLERLLAHPPMTRAMLDVLDHDDQIDPNPAASRLGVTLTPLDDMLRSVLKPLQKP